MMLMSCYPETGKQKITSAYRTEDVKLFDTIKWVNDNINELIRDSTKLKDTKFRETTEIEEMSSAIDFLSRCSDWDNFTENKSEFVNGNKRFIGLSSLVTSKSKSTLNSVLPYYRKSLAKNLANGMWKHDMYITASGSGNIYLNITSHLFVTNANIETIHTSIADTAKKYGFKQIRYRWYRNASEYTYYNIE
jgi:hypothetical protein